MEKTLLEMIKNHNELDIDLIIGGVEMEASFVTYKDEEDYGKTYLTEEGEKRFGDILNAPIKKVGARLYEIDYDDYRKGQTFCYIACGMTGNYDKYFKY